MMRTFNDLRKQNLFTDVILAVSGKGKWCFSSRNKFKTAKFFIQFQIFCIWFHMSIFWYKNRIFQDRIHYIRMTID